MFQLSPAGGGGWTYQVAHNFGSGSDGSTPYAGLVADSSGNLYGTTLSGGIYGGGTVFRFNAHGALVLHSFGLPEGYGPVASLSFDVAGNLYGTAQYGGTHGYGTVFQVIPPAALQFVAVTPCRLVDTRPQNGGSGPIQSGTVQNFPIPQEGGCHIPTSAAAYSLNVSVVPQGPLGYLTIWPAGGSQPGVATLNSIDGRIKADAAIVPAGTNGAVSVYVTNTTNLILDINGYFAPVSGSTLAFYTLAPCRIADTRQSNFPQGLGAPYLHGLQGRDFPILNATSCNIPTSAAAYSLNFSVVPHGGLGYMTVWPTGQPRPLVSTLNDIPGTIIANAAIVPAGSSGNVSVYPSSDTDLIIDINGYFAPAGAGGLSLYAVTPCRVIDTRQARSAVRRNSESSGRCRGQRLWTAVECASLRLQRDGGAGRRSGLPDAVARRNRPPRGLDLKRLGWIDHQQHGHRAQQQRQGGCVRVGDHATDLGHLQLLCAVAGLKKTTPADVLKGRTFRACPERSRRVRR